MINLIIIILIIILIIINICFFIQKTKKYYQYDGICAFDIDGTSLQGMKNICSYNEKLYNEKNGGCTAAAIQACKDKNYLLAVNTASYRPRNKYCCSTGFCKNEKCLIKENNWWNNFKYYSKFQRYGTNHGGNGKAIVLGELMKKNNIKNKNNVILWDDYKGNIDGAKKFNYGYIKMPNLKNNISNIGNIGIQQEQILDFLNYY